MPVFIAALQGHCACAKLLLEHKADPNRPKTDDGCVPLMIAAKKGHGEIVKVLLEHKADPAVQCSY